MIFALVGMVRRSEKTGQFPNVLVVAIGPKWVMEFVRYYFVQNIFKILSLLTDILETK